MADSWVGVIRGEWFGRREDKITSICYGTGVAVSPRVILTCAHTVYSESKKVAKAFTFLPSLQEGKIKKKDRIYKNSK